MWGTLGIPERVVCLCAAACLKSQIKLVHRRSGRKVHKASSKWEIKCEQNAFSYFVTLENTKNPLVNWVSVFTKRLKSGPKLSLWLSGVKDKLLWNISGPSVWSGFIQISEKQAASEKQYTIHFSDNSKRSSKVDLRYFEILGNILMWFMPVGGNL